MIDLNIPNLYTLRRMGYVGLPREVLRWLQRLDLTFSIRNPVRDLSNGFVMGEVLSRYFPDEVFVHSFGTGTSKAVRTSNWGLLAKLCVKHSITILDTATLQKVLFQDDAAVCGVFVGLYSHLQKKPLLLTPVSTTSDPKVPAYARPTASVKVRESYLERASDIEEQCFHRAVAIREHEIELRERRQTT